MTISEVLTRVWRTGLLGLARDVRRLSAIRESGRSRGLYLADPGGSSQAKGTPGGSALVDGRMPIPIGAAAVLAGIHGFLADLPKLSRRRAELQERRHVADRDILKRFGTHWLSPCPARLQSEHAAIHSGVVAAFALDAVALPDDPLLK